VVLFRFCAAQNLAQDAYVAKLKLKHEQERQMALLKQGKRVNLEGAGEDKTIAVRRVPQPLTHAHRRPGTRHGESMARD
jgi:hypothetical protein